MSSNTIGWSDTAPAITDPISNGPVEFASFKTAIEVGIGAEHVWPTSSGLAGAHKAGSARAFVGHRSAVSSADTTGRMMANIDDLRLYYVGSDGTWPIGGAHVPYVDGGTLLTSKTSGKRLTMSWTTLSTVTYQNAVTFGQSFDFPPMVFASINNTGTGIPNLICSAYNLTASVCSVFVWDATNAVIWTGSLGPGVNPVLNIVAYGVVSD